MNRKTISVALLDWYKHNQRDLPWRKTTDPYKILVSEIMLQQTQVERVKHYYKNWLQQFPSFGVLAQATNKEVIEAWAGLGYNRRALALRDIAIQVVEKGVPKNRKEWMELKGIGPYTSAAIASFSLKEPVFPIDTNIRRVIGRVFHRMYFPDLTTDAVLEESGNQLLACTNETHLVPQAIFDLATMVCKKVPDCLNCPLSDMCLSSKDFLAGTVQIPKRSIKKAKERVHRNKRYPDRIYRGRILKAVRLCPGISLYEVGGEVDTTFNASVDQQWVEDMVLRLAKDGLVVIKNQCLFLPD